MNIALIGYGRMGKAIEQIAIDRGHKIILRAENTPTAADLANADVAIEFTLPESAVNNIKSLIKNNVPTVCGTTGWLDNYEEITTLTKAQNGAFLYASNYSLGVNIFFEINKQLAKIMSKYPNYNINLEEIHHTAKLDAPSGTAITIAEGIIAENTTKKNWILDEAKNDSDLVIIAKREGDVPGTHTVTYNSEADKIEISHTAHSRSGFALGAVLAAEWIVGKKGVFSMTDVLGL